MTEVAAPPYIRMLGRRDAPALGALLDRDREVNLFVRHRIDSASADHRWLGAQIWGYFDEGELVSACHVGTNIVPVEATGEAVAAFGARLAEREGASRSVVGPADAVVPMWQLLEQRWGPARSLRLNQPFLRLQDNPTSVIPDARVRPVTIGEVDVLYPACVAMFTEEVGISPEVDNGAGYRARVTQLVARGWSFAIISDGTVLFKTEVGAACDGVCQLQGVWVNPEVRGLGLAAPALAAVVEQVRRHIAPVVTLYVNDFNTVARRVYDRLGFVQTNTFASVLF